MVRRTFLAAAACATLAGCALPTSSDSDQISTTFDGNKLLIVAAGYSINTENLYVFVWADEPAGTKATIEVNGPLHLHCDGTFLAYPPDYGPVGTRPLLDVGEGLVGLQIHTPPGSYTVTVSVPSAGVQLKKSFHGAGGGPDFYTQAYVMPLGCVPIADTRQQLGDYISLYVRGADFYVGYLEDSTTSSQLQPLAAAADAALKAGDTSTVLAAMTAIRDALRPVMALRSYNYDAYRFAVDSIALLTQAVPAA